MGGTGKLCLPVHAPLCAHTHTGKLRLPVPLYFADAVAEANCW